MKLERLCIPGAFQIDIEPMADDRGFFARTWCCDEFAAHGLSSELAQCSISFNTRRGTLRGMHFQAAPREEVKLVRCTHGAAYDVLLDLRRGSATYCRWTTVTLTAENRRMVYIPAGVAHGFQTLADNTELSYQMSEQFDTSLSRGVRWDDPAFAIEWPEGTRILSDRDRSFPDFRP